jgi:hypothetical protein
VRLPSNTLERPCRRPLLGQKEGPHGDIDIRMTRGRSPGEGRKLALPKSGGTKDRYGMLCAVDEKYKTDRLMGHGWSSDDARTRRRNVKVDRLDWGQTIVALAGHQRHVTPRLNVTNQYCPDGPYPRLLPYAGGRRAAFGRP